MCLDPPSQLLFDIIPLRVVPPLVFGAIIYRLVGLVPEVSTFWKFLLVLVLFNLATASAVLCISVAFASTGVASLVGTLVMLFKYVVSAIPFPYLMTTRLMFRSTNPIVFAFVFALFQLALRRFTHQPGVTRAGAVAQHHLVLPRRVRGARRERAPVPAAARGKVRREHRRARRGDPVDLRPQGRGASPFSPFLRFVFGRRG